MFLCFTSFKDLFLLLLFVVILSHIHHNFIFLRNSTDLSRLIMSKNVPTWYNREEIPHWVKFFDGKLPNEAHIGGRDNGEPLYIGRAKHEGSMTPGKVLMSEKICSVAWGGGEHKKVNFEMLVGGSKDNWVSAKDGVVPASAFPGGESENFETLFIGRVQHEGTITVGKIHPSHRVCYISYAGKELAFKEFEVLVS